MTEQTDTTTIDVLAEVGWPTPGRLSSPFGWRTDPIDGTYSFHRGVDIAAPVGTAVLAVATSWVQAVGEDPTYGRFVLLDHEDGVTTRYAHLDEVTVAVTQTLAVGEPVGTIGLSGRTTGPHVHFEVHRDGVVIDPVAWLRDRSAPPDGNGHRAHRSEHRTSTSA